METACCALITHLYAFLHEMYMDHISLLKMSILFTYLLFSSSVVSDSLQPHGLQHARSPCPSLSPIGKPFDITVIQDYALTSNAEEEVERFYEDLQDLLELTPTKHVLFTIGDSNEKVGSQEIPGVTGKFGLGVQNEAGQGLIAFCQENTLVIANTLFQ